MYVCIRSVCQIPLISTLRQSFLSEISWIIPENPGGLTGLHSFINAPMLTRAQPPHPLVRVGGAAGAKANVQRTTSVNVVTWSIDTKPRGLVSNKRGIYVHQD